MRYAQMRTMDISNGEGIGVTLYTSGCRFHCKNCFNSELWDINAGKEWNTEAKEQFLALADHDYISRISILGGEPFIDENLLSLEALVKDIKARYPDKKIWIYSGYSFEELLDRSYETLKYVDIIVDGRYIDELRDMNLKFRGSSNQRVIDVQESLKQKEVICYL